MTTEISTIVSKIKSLTSKSKSYKDICARFNGHCVVYDERIFSAVFITAVKTGLIKYKSIFSLLLAGFRKSGQLTTATVMKVSFKLAEKNDALTYEFLKYMKTVSSDVIEVNFSEQFLDNKNVKIILYLGLAFDHMTRREYY